LFRGSKLQLTTNKNNYREWQFRIQNGIGYNSNEIVDYSAYYSALGGPGCNYRRTERDCIVIDILRQYSDAMQIKKILL